MSTRYIYADNAATTRPDEEAVLAMLPYLREGFGNPSSLYSLGRQAHEGLEEARAQVATCLGAQPNEIYFTASGSEADNWALWGVARQKAKKGHHIVSSKIEHHAILHTLQRLEKEGWEVTYLDVDGEGFIDPAAIEAALRPDTVLATIMFANNEVGTLQPIKQLASIAHDHGILFHTDAVQAVGHVPINVAELGVDLLSLSGHKFHAPKGIGALYVRRSVLLPSFINGGGQERGKRAGTENVAGAVAMAAALKKACAEMDTEMPRIAALRDSLCQQILTNIPRTRLNGPADSSRRLPGNLNVSVDCVEGESIVLLMDMKGVAVSTGSACSTGSLDPSHVLLALGLKAETAHGSVRISLDKENTEEDADYIFRALESTTQRLRAMSPLWEEPRS